MHVTAAVSLPLDFLLVGWRRVIFGQNGDVVGFGAGDMSCGRLPRSDGPIIIPVRTATNITLSLFLSL
jgi:hypothetical protein